MIPLIQEYMDKAKDLRAKATEYEDVVKSLQKVCEHDWVDHDYGHDSHHNYVICSKCGKEERD